MELSKQVVSLELAKKLKKLGVKQESHFYWECPVMANIEDRISDIKPYNTPNFEFYSAFTVVELGELFGENFFIAFEILPFDRVSAVIYGAEGRTKGKIKNPRIICKTEVEARAKALIYLIKNKLITL